MKNICGDRVNTQSARDCCLTSPCRCVRSHQVTFYADFKGEVSDFQRAWWDISSRESQLERSVDLECHKNMEFVRWAIGELELLAYFENTWDAPSVSNVSLSGRFVRGSLKVVFDTTGRTLRSVFRAEESSAEVGRVKQVYAVHLLCCCARLSLTSHLACQAVRGAWDALEARGEAALSGLH